MMMFKDSHEKTLSPAWAIFGFALVCAGFVYALALLTVFAGIIGITGDYSGTEAKATLFQEGGAI
jgi:hypothetical protein